MGLKLGQNIQYCSRFQSAGIKNIIIANTEARRTSLFYFKSRLL